MQFKAVTCLTLLVVLCGRHLGQVLKEEAGLSSTVFITGSHI